MSFYASIGRVFDHTVRGGWSETYEAQIWALGDISTRYTVRNRNGSTQKNVEGPAGLSPGSKCTVAKYRSGKTVILSAQAGKRPDGILGVSV